MSAQPSPEVREELRRLLRRKFPWLTGKGTASADYIDYRDECGRLAKFYAEMAPPKHTTVQLMLDSVGFYNCLRCGNGGGSNEIQFQRHLREKHSVRVSLQDIRWVAERQ